MKKTHFAYRTKRHVPQSLLCILTLLLWSVITVGTILCSKAAGEYQSAYQTQTAGFEVALAACIFLLIKQSRVTDLSGFQRAAHALAPLTFPVYLCHALLIRLMIPFWVPLSFLGATAASLVFFAVSMSGSWLLSKIPVLSYLTCGISRKKQETLPPKKE